MWLLAVLGLVLHLACAAPTLTIQDLPNQLVFRGNLLFETRNLSDVMRSLEAPKQIKIGRYLLLMVQPRKDDSLSRLLDEFRSDFPYRLNEVRGNGTIVDVGGNIGFFTILAHKRYPQLPIVVFEPSPLSFFCLLINLWLNKVKIVPRNSFNRLSAGVLAVNAGVGDTKGKLTLIYSVLQTQLSFVDYESALKPSSVTQKGQEESIDIVKFASQASVNRTVRVAAKNEGWSKKEVPIINLREFLRHRKLDQTISLLKIDCEGCEFRLIPSMSDLILDREKVQIIDGEYHVMWTINITNALAGRPPLELISKTIDILKQRGCRQRSIRDCDPSPR